MNINLYREICEYLDKIIKETQYENKVYCVGGCVRDQLLMADIKDIDIVVDIDNIEEFGNWLYTNNYLLYKPVIFTNYQVCRFCFHRFPEVEIEAVIPRGEKYKEDSRNPEVVKCTLIEDAKRRDLTINSIYYDISNHDYFDPNNGIEDIEMQCINTPSDPNIIFSDDPLRMLRVIRFSARFGWKFKYGCDIEESCKNNKNRLDIISNERIRDEFSKILMTNNASKGLQMLYDTELFEKVLPEIYPILDHNKTSTNMGTYYDSLSEVFNNQEYPVTLHERLAILFAPYVKPENLFCKTEDIENDIKVKINNLMRRLKFSNDDIKQVINYLIFLYCYFLKFNIRNTPFTNSKVRKMQYFSEDIKQLNNNYLKFIKYFNKKLGSILYPHINFTYTYNLINDINTHLYTSNLDIWSNPFPINGNIIMDELNIQSGKQVKEYLDIARDIWFSEPKLTKNEIINIVKYDLITTTKCMGE